MWAFQRVYHHSDQEPTSLSSSNSTGNMLLVLLLVSRLQILAISGHGGSLPRFVTLVSWSVVELCPLGFKTCQTVLWDVQRKDAATQVPPQATSMLQYRSLGNGVVEYGLGIAENNNACFYISSSVFSSQSPAEVVSLLVRGKMGAPTSC